MRPWMREANGLSIDFMSQCKDEIQRKKIYRFIILLNYGLFNCKSRKK